MLNTIFVTEGNNTVNLDTTNDENSEIENGSSDNEERVSACSQNGANDSANNPVTEISDTPNNTRDTYSGNELHFFYSSLQSLIEHHAILFNGQLKNKTKKNS